MHHIYFAKKLFTLCMIPSVLVAFYGCKKSTDIEPAKLQTIQFRIISDDPNISSVGLTADAIQSNGVYVDSKYQLFQHVNTRDTFVMTLNASPGLDFINSSFQPTMHVSHLNKVYSPALAAAGVYIEGEPYKIGWHYSRRWQLKQAEIVHSLADSVYYIRLNADTSKYNEVLW
jgi:hypothetical protein